MVQLEQRAGAGIETDGVPIGTRLDRCVQRDRRRTGIALVAVLVVGHRHAGLVSYHDIRNAIGRIAAEVWMQEAGTAG